jgi:hypothetical protein
MGNRGLPRLPGRLGMGSRGLPRLPGLQDEDCKIRRPFRRNRELISDGRSSASGSKTWLYCPLPACKLPRHASLCAWRSKLVTIQSGRLSGWFDSSEITHNKT